MTTAKLDEKKPYAVIYGSTVMRYEQAGLYYDVQKCLIGTPAAVQPALVKQARVVTDRVDSAQAFLLNILRNGQLTKAAVYKTAENNNQLWEDVKTAADLLDVVRYKQNGSGAEMWKLNPEMAVPK